MTKLQSITNSLIGRVGEKTFKGDVGDFGSIFILGCSVCLEPILHLTRYWSYEYLSSIILVPFGAGLHHRGGGSICNVNSVPCKNCRSCLVAGGVCSSIVGMLFDEEPMAAEEVGVVGLPMVVIEHRSI